MKKIILITLAVCIAAIMNVNAQTPWFITGNAGTNASTNFIGTTDNKTFKIRTNNVVRMTISSAGKVGIGTASPVFKLDVKGGSINTDSVYRIGGNTVLSVKGSGNTFTGIGSGFSNTTGIYNTVNGVNALYSNTTGHSNTAIGINALVYNTTGYYNTASGRDALFSNTTGSNNTAIGYEALFSNTTGIYNTANGMNTLRANTTGFYNTANGFVALYSNTTGSNNTATGTGALYSNTTGDYNTANGSSALYSNTTGDYNTANGYAALFSNTTGNYNTANGRYALFNNTTGISNTAVGSSALLSNTSTTGWANTGVGFEALKVSTISSGNTAIGYHAGGNYDNSYDNTFLGNQADANAAGFHSSTAVGAGTIITASDQVHIGWGATSIGGPQNWTNTSDGRIKINVLDDVPGLLFIKLLRPVTYNKSIKMEVEIIGRKNTMELHADNAYEKIRYSGFIAQEVEQAANMIGYDFSGVDAPKNDKDLYGLRYAEFVVPLVKAVQELNEELKMENAALKAQDAMLKNEIAQIKSVLSDDQQQRLSALQNTKASLEQNIPNPFNKSTVIKYYVPENFNDAQLRIYSSQGVEMKAYTIKQSGKGEITIEANTLAAGIYSYTLIVDDNATDVKQMIITK